MKAFFPPPKPEYHRCPKISSQNRTFNFSTHYVALNRRGPEGFIAYARLSFCFSRSGVLFPIISKIFADSQIFLDPAAGSGWIGFFSIDYVRLAVSRPAACGVSRHKANPPVYQPRYTGVFTRPRQAVLFLLLLFLLLLLPLLKLPPSLPARVERQDAQISGMFCVAVSHTRAKSLRRNISDSLQKRQVNL